jgi:hypothetical protein
MKNNYILELDEVLNASLLKKEIGVKINFCEGKNKVMDDDIAHTT